MKSSLAQTARIGSVMICLWMSIPVCAHGALIAIEDNNVLKNQGVQGTGGEATTFLLKRALTTESNARIGYLKFDLSSIAESALNEGTFTITNTAVAAVSGTPITGTLRAYALNAGVAGFNWSEDAITYANRPAFNDTSPPLVNTAQVTAVGADINIDSLNGNAAAGSNYSFTFANLENFRQPDNTLTFIVLITTQSNSTPNFNFASSEHSNEAIRPRLTVTAIPEPTAFGLLGLGIAGVFAWRRRRVSSVR